MYGMLYDSASRGELLDVIRGAGQDAAGLLLLELEVSRVSERISMTDLGRSIHRT